MVAVYLKVIVHHLGHRGRFESLGPFLTGAPTVSKEDQICT